MDDTFSPVEHARENNEAIQHTLRKLVELWPELGAGDCNLNVLFSNGKVRRVASIPRTKKLNVPIHISPTRTNHLD